MENDLNWKIIKSQASKICFSSIFNIKSKNDIWNILNVHSSNKKRFRKIWTKNFSSGLWPHQRPSAHVSGRNIWINFEAPQWYICWINPWKTSVNLMYFLKYLASGFWGHLGQRRQILRLIFFISKRQFAF